MTYVIKLKRTTKGFSGDEGQVLNATTLEYGEAIFLEKYGYLAIGRQTDQKTKVNEARVFKAIPRSMADNGLYFDNKDDTTNFVDVKAINYTIDGDGTSYGSTEQLVYPKTKFNAVTDENDTNLTDRLNLKMDKANPIGTGYLSINRKSNTTIGSNSAAVGYENTATSNSAFAEGYQTEARGLYSHAEGYQTLANATSAHAEGSGTIASSQNQSVSGKYNIQDSSSNFAAIIGNGISTSNRSNAAALDWNGNLYLKGNLYVNGSNANATGGSSSISFNSIENLYEWQQYKTSYSTSTTASASLKVYGNKTTSITSYELNGLTIFYGSSYTLDAQYGVYQINNPTILEITYDNKDAAFAALPVNTYFTIHKYSRTMYQKTSSSYQEISTQSGGYIWVDWFSLKKLTISNFQVKNFSKLASTNRNEYPDSGLVNSFYYVFLGKFGERHNYTIDIPYTRTKYPGNVIKIPVLNASIMEVSQCQDLRFIDGCYIYPQTLIINQTNKISIRQTPVSNDCRASMDIIWGSYGSYFESGGCYWDTVHTSAITANDIISMSLQRAGKIFISY